MSRRFTLIGAATSIGIRPYDDGTPRRLWEAPQALRAAGIAATLNAADAGDLTSEPYRDLVRTPGRVRNEPEVERYTAALADRVTMALDAGTFPIVLGGDCSIVLGSLWGARRARRHPIGLAYLDAHSDFATPDESRTGSAASMCLALSVGRGDTPLSRLAGAPLVEDRHVALVGRRDHAEPWYGHAALRASSILDLPDEAIRTRPADAIVSETLAQAAPAEVDGFWVHFDADLLSPGIMPAVDSPVAGGPTLEEAVALLGPLVTHPKAIGLELTIYDPSLDPAGEAARTLVTLVTRAFHDGRA